MIYIVLPGNVLVHSMRGRPGVTSSAGLLLERGRRRATKEPLKT